MSHCKALLCAIKYVTDTKDYFYLMKPDRNINGPCNISGYSDADYAGDNDTHKIVPLKLRSAISRMYQDLKVVLKM